MSIKISAVPDIIVSLYNNEQTRHRTLFLKGASGVGKSDTVRQAAEVLGVDLIDLRLAQLDPTDLKGIPYPVDGVTQWAVPGFFPQDPESAGILFLDEITSAPPAIQAAGYQLVLDRALGDYQLPDGWMIIAAGNRTSDRGVTYQMAAPLQNRVTELDVEHTLEGILDYGAGNGLDPRVMAFLSERADLVHKFGKEEYGKPFPSPRGWFAVSPILDMDLPQAYKLDLIIGSVGHEAGIAFEAFLRVWDKMPSISKILAGEPEQVPTDLGTLACVTMGLSARLTAKGMDKAWDYLMSMPREMSLLAIKLAYKRDKSLAQAKMFGEWARSNKDLFKELLQ
jgi:hypothetical protein